MLEKIGFHAFRKTNQFLYRTLKGVFLEIQEGEGMALLLMTQCCVLYLSELILL